ncbi:MAG TPA: ATP-binding cassette domain-containing protein [archaeon]|nr:ATP-binding cassette domain-containing protein [archaeon]
MEPIVSVKNLKKTYKGGIRAVKGVSFELREGEIFGFLGPNGAGKTTTIKMLTTLLKPTDGEARVCGFDVRTQANQVRECIGVVFQQPALDNMLTARENLEFHARLYGLAGDAMRKRIGEVLRLVDLEQKADLLVKTFSGGMQRRLELARGLMHSPRVLFLDEPTLGLDVQTRAKVWEYIMRVRKSENMTIFLTTHYMEEAEKVCERVAIIDEGMIMKIDTPENLVNEVCDSVISVKTGDKIKQIKGVQIMKKNHTVELGVKDARQITRVVGELMKNYEIEELSIRKASLEDVYLKLTGKTIRDQETKSAGGHGPMRHGGGRH